MIRICRATDLWMSPKLAATMYADRRRQFKDRLGWSVVADTKGYERDEYDELNPVYVIVEDGDGEHEGSLRLLPTTGNTMIADYFSATLEGQLIVDPNVWECTRFCLSPKSNRTTSLKLLAVSARLMLEARLKKIVAIFDPRMVRVYRRCGVSPKIIGSHRYAEGKIISGYWDFSTDVCSRLMRSSEIDLLQLESEVSDFSIPWRKKVPEENDSKQGFSDFGPGGISARTQIEVLN